MDDKNLTVDKEVKDQLVLDMTQKLLDMIDKQVVASMSHGAVEKLNELLDRNATEVEIQQHISASVPDINQIVAKTAYRFRELYLETGK